MKTVRSSVLLPLFCLPLLAWGAFPGRAAENAPPASAAPSGAPTQAELNRIRALLQMGRGKEALPLAEAAVKAAPGDAPVQFLYGQSLAAVERPKDAVAALGRATALDPKNPDAFVALGNAHFLRFTADLRSWVKSHSNDMLGEVHARIPTAISAGPASPAALVDDILINDRSASQMNGKEWDQFAGLAKEALSAYTSALALDPAHKAATQGKGLAQLVLGKWKETAEAFEQAGAPPFDSFLFELARNVHDARIMGDDSMRLWAAVEQSDPTNPWAYWYQRELYDEFRHKDFRYAYFDAMCKLFSGQIRDESDAKRYTPKDALKDLQGFTEAHADYAPGWRGRGIAALALKDTKQARAAFEKAVTLDEKDWYSSLQLGVMLLNDKKGADAQKTLAKAARANPTSAVTWNALGGAAELNKDLDAAVSYYERAADIAPAWDKAHYDLGALLLDRRQGSEALPHLRRYLELNPKARNAGEVQSAIEQLEKILSTS